MRDAGRIVAVWKWELVEGGWEERARRTGRWSHSDGSREKERRRRRRKQRQRVEESRERS